MTKTGRAALVKIRVQCGDAFALGPGKADLLEAIDACRSIAGAGRRLGCSYWKTRHMIDEMNRCFREPVVETAKGGPEHGGAVLTDTGRTALEAFRTMERLAAQAIQCEFRKLEGLLADSPEA